MVGHSGPVSESLPLRPALPGEFDRIADICVDAYSTGGHLRENDPYTEVLRDVAGRAQAGPVLVYERDGSIAGTVTICPPGTEFSEIARPGEFEFRFLAVDPSHWGKGIGPGMVEACDQLARENGDTAIVICVISINTQARRMYERMGFDRFPERDWSPNPQVDLLAYRRRVGD